MTPFCPDCTISSIILWVTVAKLGVDYSNNTASKNMENINQFFACMYQGFSHKFSLQSIPSPLSLLQYAVCLWIFQRVLINSN